MRGRPVTARRAALDLLTQVAAEKRLLSEVLADPAFAALPPETRAAAQRLALATLRGGERADALLAPHLKKSPPAAVRRLLRLATVELAQGGAAHGVVKAAVDLASEGRKTASFRGLVNAVLRRVAEDAPAAWAAAPVPRLPNWLRGRIAGAWGEAATRAMEAAHLAGAPLDLSAKGDAAALAEATGGTLLPTGSVRRDAAGQVSALPGYGEGAFWVQDAAAALPARMLGDVAGRRVLDLCAAPGGKTLQLAAAGARVTALDLSAPRLRRLEENLARTGLAAEVVAADALHWQGGPFDAVLLDAPCSATGTIRRHPDLPLVKEAAGLKGLVELQAALIDRALGLLVPGGALVYCTCSLLPEEGEAQIAAALARHPGLTVTPVLPEGVPEAWQSPEGGLRTRPDYWPEAGGLDGFYMARLTAP
ncbi:RsmB/NOP family class I SAM-dependent RNA methyltransferase [Roseivivax sp. CAU 1761]